MSNWFLKGMVLNFGMLLAAPAFAQVTPPPSPAACALTQQTDVGYQAGFNSGAGLARLAWLRVGQDCARVDELNDIITHLIGTLAAPLSASAYSQCRFSGIVDGLAAFLAQLLNSCRGDCEDDGAVLGAIYAQGYCELAILLDGLADPGAFFRPPTNICGEAFQTSCDSSFDLTAISYVNASLQACGPFVLSPHHLEAANTRQWVCTFEDVPVTPSP
jgi:hypothetical protein